MYVFILKFPLISVNLVLLSGRFFCKKIIKALIKLPTYVATETIEKKIDVFF